LAGVGCKTLYDPAAASGRTAANRADIGDERRPQHDQLSGSAASGLLLFSWGSGKPVFE
jgi:hypothetical protein